MNIINKLDKEDKEVLILYLAFLILMLGSVANDINQPEITSITQTENSREVCKIINGKEICNLVLHASPYFKDSFVWVSIDEELQKQNKIKPYWNITYENQTWEDTKILTLHAEIEEFI